MYLISQNVALTQKKVDFFLKDQKNLENWHVMLVYHFG